MSGYIIPIVYYDQRVAVSGTTAATPPLGHAGFAVVDATTGVARYFEYGRYSNTSGIVVERPMDAVNVSNRDSFTNSVIASINKVNNQNGSDRSIYVDVISLDRASLDRTIQFVESKIDQPGAYGSWTPWNSCYTFMKDVVTRAGITLGEDRTPAEFSIFNRFLNGYIPAETAIELFNNRGGLLLSPGNTPILSGAYL